MTSIRNDGETLRMHLRGVEFKGHMFDDWEPIDPIDHFIAARFHFHRSELCAYALDFEMPVLVAQAAQETQGVLRAHLELGRPSAKGGIDSEKLQLDLVIGRKVYSSHENQGWFDDALCEIRTLLPEGTFLKLCHSCAYSDYSPAGYGLFGGLACFRNCKQEYLALKGKAAYFALANKMAGFVQETYLCPEFEKRVSGTGYRG